MQDDLVALNKWGIFITRVTDSYIEIDGKFKWALFLKTWIITCLFRCYNEACSVQTTFSQNQRYIVIPQSFICSLFTTVHFLRVLNFEYIIITFTALAVSTEKKYIFPSLCYFLALSTKKAISFINVRLQARQVWFYYYFNIVIIFYF